MDSINRETRLHEIMEEVRCEHNLLSILLADQRGLTLCYCGDVHHSGIAAIAPEFVRLGDNAVRLGEYESISCVALLLENSHLMIIKEVSINEKKFILVIDATSTPKSLQKVIASLAERIGLVLKA